jgi:hypothetical protein
MKKFIDRLAAFKADSEILNIDAQDLLLHLSKDCYARIEVSFPINESSFPSTLDPFQVSKISDAWYPEIRETLAFITHSPVAWSEFKCNTHHLFPQCSGGD